LSSPATIISCKREDGTPFFWQGDTAWLLFSKLDRRNREVADPKPLTSRLPSKVPALASFLGRVLFLDEIAKHMAHIQNAQLIHRFGLEAGGYYGNVGAIVPFWNDFPLWLPV